jgi:hypothetical protein
VPLCVVCKRPLPEGSRSHRLTCSDRHRKRLSDRRIRRDPARRSERRARQRELSRGRGTLAADFLAFSRWAKRRKAAEALTETAVDFLGATLADGPVASRRIKLLAERAGITDYRLKRARERAGVVTKRVYGRPRWTSVWTLPQHSDTSDTRTLHGRSQLREDRVAL